MLLLTCKCKAWWPIFRIHSLYLTLYNYLSEKIVCDKSKKVHGCTLLPTFSTHFIGKSCKQKDNRSLRSKQIKPDVCVMWKMARLISCEVSWLLAFDSSSSTLLASLIRLFRWSLKHSEIFVFLICCFLRFDFSFWLTHLSF